MPKGGYRPGAGRKPSLATKLARAVEFIETNGTKAEQSTATRILGAINEVEQWGKLLGDKNPRIRMESLKYLTDRRDGKPSQSVAMNLAGGFTLINGIVKSKGGEANG
jgi:hypothetical protein